MSLGTGIDLVLVGHFGIAEDHTPTGSSRSLGGSGYACAVGAGAGTPDRVGVVGNIGDDFDFGALERLGVDRQGAIRVPGKAPHLTITQHTPTDRSFASDLGVAARPPYEAFPDAYAAARHLHVGTMPVGEQARWLALARQRCRCTVSVDMFEPTAIESPDESRELCYGADLVFMNQEERRLLFTDHPLPHGEIVLKSGADGARYRVGETWTHVPAPRQELVDSTGAGEVLAGAFLSLRGIGLSATTALRYAVRAASAKVTEFGVDGDNLRRTLSGIHREVAKGVHRAVELPAPVRE
jgi:ribokinase